MSNRVVYGNSFSSDGWPMVDTGSCTWVNVPGTAVTLQIQNGWPLAILRAFAADFNAYVEPLRDADSACWTATNSVSTSNHLSGTAMDLNWDSHPFQVPDAGFDAGKIAAVRGILDFYEGTVFWGNDWSDPKDAMHFQLSSLANGGPVNTYNNPATGDFIARKIRADGFSTYQRGNNPAPPPPLSRADGYALLIIGEGQRSGITPRGIQIALSVTLVETNLTMYANSNVPASLNLPHDAVGSDHDSTGLFQQRQAWGPLSSTMDPTLSARLFFQGGQGGQRGLTDFDYDSDSRTPGGWAQAVQVSAFPDRYDGRFQDAVDIYNRLANVTTDPGDDMAAVPQDQWDRVYRELTQRLPSRSPLRHLDQTQYYPDGLVDTMAGMLLNTDGSEHVQYVSLLAGYGHPPTIALLKEVASAAGDSRYPDRQDDAKLAQAILAQATQAPATFAPVDTTPIAAPQPQVVYLPAPAAPTPAPVADPSEGDLIGNLFENLKALRLADALPIEGRAPLAALISVLQTKNGSQL